MSMRTTATTEAIGLSWRFSMEIEVADGVGAYDFQVWR
jgi:hypothetical protein